MCNTTSFGDTNHVKFHLHLPWIRLSLYPHGKGQTPPGWEPKGCRKLLWNISVHPSGHWEGRGSQIFLLRLMQFIELRPFGATDPSAALQDSLTVSPGSSTKCCSLSCCLWLNWPILQQMRPQGKVNPSRNIKRQIGASVNSLSLAKPLSPSLTFLPFILKYSDLTRNSGIPPGG